MGRRRLAAALAVALLAAAAAGGAGAARAPVTLALKGSHAQFVPGQVVVRFRAGAGRAARRQALSTGAASTVRRLAVPGLQLVHVHGSVAAAIDSLERDPAVAYAEPNYLYHATATPNDPRYSQLWGLAKISAPAAWDVTTGSNAVVVGVVDTGITTDHLDLAGNVVPGYDFVQNDADPRDFNGHGTHVAGTIGARGNNGIGVTGVDWQVSLMPVRVLDGAGSGTNANVTSGLAYACQHGASIVNASLGGTGYSQAMRDAIAACPSTLFVVAAGNNGVSDDLTPHYPCNYGAPPSNLANIVCVGATDNTDHLAGFSNFGTSVDLAAPGVDVESTWPAYDTLATEGFDGPFSWAPYTPAGLAFGRSATHSATGSYSATDSPVGNYLPNSDTQLLRPSSMASLAGRVGCQLSYKLLLDTESGHDYFWVLGSSDAATYGGDQWSGSTSGSFIPLTSDMSRYDGAAQFFPALKLTSDGDSVVGDGGYLDDLTLRCLRPAADAYETISGTSMATPHVTGVAALVKAAHPSYTAAQVKAAILKGVDRLPSLNGRVASGGRLDACKALGRCGVAFKPPCVVPRVVGKKLAAARRTIASRHCRVGKVRYAKSTKKRKGHVVRESPSAGRHLGASARVNLWIGKGPARR
jgi:subtilisin family serine protease